MGIVKKMKGEKCKKIEQSMGNYEYNYIYSNNNKIDGQKFRILSSQRAGTECRNVITKLQKW